MRDALPHASFVGFTGTQGIPARRHAGTAPHVPDLGRTRAAVDAIGMRHSRLADDLRPLIERLYTLDLLARAG
nr:E13 [uncultured bacterium]